MDGVVHWECSFPVSFLGTCILFLYTNFRLFYEAPVASTAETSPGVKGIALMFIYLENSKENFLINCHFVSLIPKHWEFFEKMEHSVRGFGENTL